MLAILPGLKGMLNYHPLFVHFPIAFWLGALLFEILAVARSSPLLPWLPRKRPACPLHRPLHLSMVMWKQGMKPHPRRMVWPRSF